MLFIKNLASKTVNVWTVLDLEVSATMENAFVMKIINICLMKIEAFVNAKFSSATHAKNITIACSTQERRRWFAHKTPANAATATSFSMHIEKNASRSVELLRAVPALSLLFLVLLWFHSFIDSVSANNNLISLMKLLEKLNHLAV